MICIKHHCNRSLSAICAIVSLMVASSLPAQTPDDGQRLSLCPISASIPPRPLIPETLLLNDLFLTANQAESIENGMSTLIGNAELARNQQQLTADRIDYNQPSDIVDLLGKVNYWDNDVYLNSSSAHIELESENGSFEDVRYWLLDTRGRGKADQINVIAGDRAVGIRVDYTTCDPDTDGPWNLTTNIWSISASRLTLNHETDMGSGRNVILKVKNIPVFYTPWLSFPLSDKRKTGFLLPGFGSSTRNGAEIQTPWYWNIAPQMDATITPRAMSKTGIMLAGQYRYAFTRGAGMLDVEYLPSDSQYDDKSRNSIAYDHRQTFLRNGYLAILYNRVSDQRYLEDFSSSLLGSSTQFLEQTAVVTYGWNLAGHSLGLYNVVGNFQIVDRNLPVASRPYKRLPSTTLSYTSPYRNRQLNYSLVGRFDHFTRGDDALLDSINGIRQDIFPTFSLPINELAYFVEPKAGVRFTRYSLDENNTFDNTRPNRLLPFFSLDGGIFLERNTELFGEQILQTLEPRIYYLYVPEEDQTNLPVFDTGQSYISFASLFRDNRFTGIDRIGDANQVTASATSRLYSETSGHMFAYFSLGQTYYLQDRTVSLPGWDIPSGNRSVIISEAGAVPFDQLELRAEFQWDPNLEAVHKLSFSAMYRPAPGKVINVAYRDTKPDPYDTAFNNLIRVEQADISFRWPIRTDLSVVGKWNYAIEEDRMLDLFGGIEYNSCCWGVRVVGRRFLSNIEGDFESGVFLQFELKGLAGIGEKTVDFLSRSIPGYESEF